MYKIPLGRSKKYALVDKEDFKRLSKFNWCLFNGYAGRYFNSKVVYMHRLIANTPPSKITDHINKDRLDNRSLNLRACSVSQNAQNQKSRIN